MGEINWQVVNIVICLVAATISVYMLLLAWQRRAVVGATWFAGMVAAGIWILVFYAFEAAAGADLNTYLTLGKLEYVGLTAIPLTWLGFALTFSRNDRYLSRLRLGLLALIPLVTIALVWTNEWHGLIWSQPRFNAASPPEFIPVYGVWFWVYLGYSYLLFLIGSFVLVRSALQSWKLYRTQSILILIGTSFPWLGNLAETVNFAPIPGLYLNAISLVIAAVCLSFALFRLHLLDVMPLAYDLILNNVPDGVIVVDTQNRVLALNRPVKRYLDNPAQDPVGQPVAVVFSKWVSQWGMPRGVLNQTQVQIADKTIQIRVSPVFDRQRRLRGRLFILSDVTARAQTEQKERDEHLLTETLRQVANMLNSTLDAHQVLTLIVESVSCVASHDKANVMMLDDDGYTARVAAHHRYSPEDALRLEQQTFDIRQYATLARAAAGEAVIIPDTSQEPEWKSDDALVQVQSYACVPIQDSGKVVGFINLDSTRAGALTAEVAARLQIFADQAGLAIKNARLYEQMRRQKEELNQRIESLTLVQWLYKEITYSFNSKNLLDLALDAAMRLCRAEAGYIALMQEQQLRITHCYGNFALGTLTAMVETRAGIIGICSEQRRAVRLLPPEPVVVGLEGAVAQIALPLYAREGETPDGFYGVMVLETRKPERFTDDRFQLLELLANRVASALENAQLVQAVQSRAAELEVLNGRLSRLEHLKSDMIRIAAHDLKNPLGVMMGYVEQIIHEDPSSTLGQYSRVFNAMQRSVDRMKLIIQEILSLERIEQMAEQQTMHPFDLCHQVETVLAEFAQTAADKQQRLEQTVLDTDCRVSGDVVQIHEVIVNFISNAIKYTPPGGQINAVLSKKENCVLLEVKDTGYGIPENQQARLFEPFYRAKTKETAKIDGTGLGLHLVKNVVERHHGQVIFSSVYGQGSTFGFRLPAYPAADCGCDEQ